ncbi:MAG: DUF2628 domain-containing protein [Roseiarcus sp.]|jgi:hypothetical protein
MTIFAAHCAPDFRRSSEALERARVFRVGFVWPALVFGPLWLIARRLWRPLALWIVAAALVAAAATHGLLNPGAVFWLYLLAALYLGFEGRALEAAALTRRGRPLADIVCADDSSGAERAFFARAVDLTEVAPPPAPPRGGPPSNAPHTVIGLFPEAGG